jgi:transposase
VHRACTAALEHHTQKKSLLYSEQQDPKVQKQRRAWQRKVRDIEPGRFKFLDQTNAKTTFTRVFARAPRGQRVHEYVPDGRWESLTLMGTLGYWGDTTALTYEGGTDVSTMLTFLEKVLVPAIDRDHIVVMDRLSSHMDPEVAQAVRKTGAQVWHLPPYSHDFNPIENMWSKVKAYLRKVKPRDLDALIAAIGDALRTITAEDAHGWYRHCGYN